MQNFVKVGPKNRHLEILNGYYLVTTGTFKKGDLCANIYKAAWEHIDEEDYKNNLSVEIYDFVIRKNINTD
jgi:hypothetical protein